jgi:prepilin-type N-terminal cleavage/methylation domain-containing protein
MSRFRRAKWDSGFNMLELMVVVVILGLLSAIAVPIYARYVRSSRVSEALSRVGELFTAARTYAIANETDGDINSTAGSRTISSSSSRGSTTAR